MWFHRKKPDLEKWVEGDLPLTSVFAQVKARETAPLVGLEPDPHAASDQLCTGLAQAKDCLLDYWTAHRDHYSNDYNECEKPDEECLWCAEAEIGMAAIDRAIHVLREMK